MDSAKPASPSPNSPDAALIPDEILSIGKWTPMTPVEATATSPASSPSASAPSACIARASSMPRSPVAALALPLFATTARTPPLHSLSRHDERRTPNGVAGEHGRRLAGPLGEEEPEIPPPNVAYPTPNPSRHEARGSRHTRERDFILIVESLFITGAYCRTRLRGRQPVYAET